MKKRLAIQIFTNVRRTALFMLSMVLSLGFVFAQERTITGTVTTEGEVLPGVNVIVQGTTIGAITGPNGAYTIKVPGPTAVLVFSSIGYLTKQVTVGSQTVIDMILQSDILALQEVVVTGYTAQRRRDLTGSVGVVEPAKLTAVPMANVSNQLQGRTSGVSVIGNGQPGSRATVRIRGFGSFQNNDPLYIVDGVPTQDISSMNPNDVESISVLKDAGAASIYGSRASNGVIIVTTKKGGKGTKVTYDMYFGTQSPGKGPTKDLLTTQEYADLQWLVYANDGTNTIDPATGLPKDTHPIYGPSTNPAPTLPAWAANTDWYDEFTNPAAMQNHDITLSGGSDNSKYFAGLGYFSQDGIVIYTYNKKYTLRFNSEYSVLKDRVKVGENFTMTYRDYNEVSNLQENSPVQMGSYREQPIIPVIIPAGVTITGLSHNFIPGDWGGTGIASRLGNSSNTVANLTRDKDDKFHNIRLIGSAFVDIKILQGLNFRSTAGGTWNNGWGVNYTSMTYENSENTATPSLNENAYFGSDWVWTNILTLDKTFGQHKILAVAGYEAVKYGMGRELAGNRSSYFTDDPNYRTLNNGANIVNATSDYYTPTTLVSQFMRADYSFRDKYMLSATVRRDGSSRFGADNRYGVFPSFSAGWRISDEPFFQGIGFISDLKIRGSYGTMGNQLAVSPMNQYYTYGGDPGTAFYDIDGTFTSSVQGFRPVRIGNPDAKWETNITTDIGFEAGLIDNKLTIKFDWYSRKTKDLLYDPELPGTAGAASQPFINIASMSNTGLDMELTYRNRWGDLGFDGSVNLTTYNNEISKIAEGVNFFDYGGSRIGAFVRNMEGHPMSAFYGYQVIGLFQDASEVSSAPTQDGAEAGFFRYADTDGDSKITPTDRVFIGNPNPKFTYGLNLTFTYKNFDLTSFIYGSQGNDIFNWNKWWVDFWPSFQGQKSKELFYDSWTPDRTNTSVPKASNKSNFSTNTQSISYYIEDGSFLRMKNLQLGYTIPQSILNKVNIKSFRIYVQAVNLFTLTKYSGLDPEIGSDPINQANNSNDRNFGVDYGNYPLVRQYIVGLNLTF